MTLMEQIKQKQLAARKEGLPIASLYTTLLGEAAMIGKNAGDRETTDAEVVAVVKKFIKNTNETIDALTTRGQNAEMFVIERMILEEFLPQQLDEVQLTIIARYFKSMPEFMKALKERYAGQYDGKLASMVAKKVFV
jgi:uncharacterized protein YqeY